MSQPLTHQVIRASAGTGKTYTLTQRYIRLLRRDAQPDMILAATFTRKAAGEILERLLARLADAAESETAATRLCKELRDPDLDITVCRNLLVLVCRSLHRVTICTIDSFFNRMVQCFGLELDVPRNAMIVADEHPVAVQLRRQAIDAMLGDDDLHVMLDMLRRIQHDTAQRSITEALDQIVGGDLYDLYRASPDVKVWTRLTLPETFMDTLSLTAAIGAMSRLTDEMPNQKWAQAWHRHLAAALAHAWEDFLASGLASAVAKDNPKFANREISGNIRAVLQPLVAHAKASLIARVIRQTEATHDLLRRFDEHYTRLRQLHGVMLYSDLPFKLATQLPRLGEDLTTELYFRLDTRVTHLMLDEFQDTSVRQWSILRPFAEEIRSHGDPDESGRSFFCVGDVKQAIYDWRGGCAEIFDQIERDLYLPRDPTNELTRSYRSSPIILDAVTRVFSGLSTNPALTEHRDRAQKWQERFVEHQAADAAKVGYVALLTSPAVNGEESEVDEESEYASGGHDHFVAEQIERIARTHPRITIGVLVRTNKKVTALIHLLRQRGLDASGEGGVPLTDDPAVNVILSALRMADHPGDTAAAFHVVNSPLGEIVGLRSTQPGHIASAALTIRRDLAERGYGYLLTEWSRFLAPSCNQRSAIRLFQLLELADGYRPVTTHRPIDFVRYVEATPVDDPIPARIRVMTVHKAKGLEFDAVVLPELDSAIDRQHDLLAYVKRESPTAPPSAIYRAADKKVRDLYPELERAYELEMDRKFHDELCALYVAMTRPRHALYMLIPPLTETKNGFGARGNTTASFAAILRHALRETKETVHGNQCLFQRGEPNWAERLEHPVATSGAPSEMERKPSKLAATSAQSRRSWQRVAPSKLVRQAQVRVADLLALNPERSYARGTLIHAWLQHIEWLSDATPNETELRRIATAKLGTCDADWLSAEIADFQTGLARPAIRQIFAPSTKDLELWREHRFAVHLDGILMEGAFDRVVVYQDRAELIDFKTDRVPDEGCATLVETYRPQMKAYRQSLAHLLELSPEKIKVSLLFWATGECVQVT